MQAREKEREEMKGGTAALIAGGTAALIDGGTAALIDGGTAAVQLYSCTWQCYI